MPESSHHYAVVRHPRDMELLLVDGELPVFPFTQGRFAEDELAMRQSLFDMFGVETIASRQLMPYREKQARLVTVNDAVNPLPAELPWMPFRAAEMRFEGRTGHEAELYFVRQALGLAIERFRRRSITTIQTDLL